ncbi:hypothetical protein P691DRAFT_800391 [Macrolepiota fuliginosa MF-IS2]|uniref:F-box domain-containing protein n=1 Tax=Macrolepiota fuliginosa MF-IS2 TaxID=1400762 RepID=A0A9P5XG92_9AGAR|nr:hypothetical protein P691DRAFT_800391 [Macrolepiota fuliginosa MF-IS2]
MALGDRVLPMVQFLTLAAEDKGPEVSEAEISNTTQMANLSLTATSAKPANVTLLDLPPEILTHVLLHLPFTSVVICQGVNRHLQVLISESTELQYYIHLGVYGQVDNPRCDLPISERLSLLLARERCWEELDLDFSSTVEVPFQFKFLDPKLSPGLLYGVTTGGDLRYMRVPTVPDQKVDWGIIRSGETIITAGLCVCERDLQVLITAQPQTVHTNTTGFHTVNVIQMHLNQLSTGGPHPEAHQAIISFETHEQFRKPHIVMECAGDNLLLVLRDRTDTFKPDDQIYVYEWKTGDLKLRANAPFSSYRFPLFLTTHIFLLPNINTGELEYWRIPKNQSETTPSRPFFILSLPQPRSGAIFYTLTCRAEPNPSIQIYNTSKPFYTDPHHAIVNFYVSVWSGRYAYPEPRCFKLLIHRSSLVGCLDKYSASASFNNPPKPIPYGDWGPPICRWFNLDGASWTETTFGQRYIAPPPLDVGPEGAPLTVLNFNPMDVARVLAAEKHRLKAKILDEDRWMTGNHESERAAGLSSEDDPVKEVQCGEGNKGVPPQIHEGRVLGISSDQLVEKTEAKFRSSEPPFSAKAIIQSLDPLDDPYGCFENTVYSSLPYTSRQSRGKYNPDILVLDEESVLGIREGDERRIKEIHILHYG